MAIPYSIQEMRSGIIGTIAYDGPTRAVDGILNSGTEANNVFGRVFTHTDEDTVQAGGAGLLAGVMINPHANGIGEDFVANGRQSEFMHMGEVFVTVAGTAPALGDEVYFVPATGELTTTALSNTLIQGATLSRHTPRADGAGFFAVLSLTGILPTSA